MKRFIGIFAGAALALVLGTVLTFAATDYTSSVSGHETSRGKNNVIIISATTNDDLSGGFTISVKHTNGTITGGKWERVVIAQSDDGSKREVGSLKGTVSGGSANVDADGVLISINAELRIDTGTVAYASITEGTGSFNVSSNLASHSEINGRLNMSF